MGAPYRESARTLPEPPRSGRTLFISLVPSVVLIAIGLGARVTLREEEGSQWELGVLVALVAIVYFAVIRMDLEGRR
ncbi:MAG: hypothetical protein ABSE49_00490 [Polyangiaceae bacterium]|jgi:hypothetical protein